MAIPVRVSAARSGAAGNSTFSARKIAFRAQGGIKNSGHGGDRPASRRYCAGDTVRQSGIYEVIHDRSHREAHEVVMISGEHFPDCETCKEKVRFRLVRTAPYIFQDEDFEEDA
ncbi:MAG TPA: hypothetical protein VMD98_12375 [Bryocella sp.]|nr:hypothetical protein [Bryocella sp.]